MTTLLSGLMLVAAAFWVVTIAGYLVWFWKNRQRLPRWERSKEYEYYQKDYYLNHQAEYHRPHPHQYSDKINRAA